MSDNNIITWDGLLNPEVVFTLGMVIAKLLRDSGEAHVFVSREGTIELCPPWEISLDGLPEDQAIEHLMSRGYSDEQLALYLKGRESRAEAKTRVKNMRQVSV